MAASLASNTAEITLLAVSETPDGYVGEKANLYVEIRRGDGNVFLDSSPLTKLDTQLSMRLGREMACNYLEIDCRKYDFFYTIRSASVIVGGPSAGSAAAVATVAALQGWKINKSISITGLLDSGGLISEVGGIKPKIEAASRNNLGLVLIPDSEPFPEEDNKSINLTDFGHSIGITVIGVSTLEEALYHFFGDRIHKKRAFSGEIVPPAEYTNTMTEIATELCKRADSLKNKIIQDNLSLFQDGISLYEKGKASILSEKPYSGASYCFGSAFKFSSALYLNLSREAIDLRKQQLLNEAEQLESKADKTMLRTVNDLQALMVVKERLTEAIDSLKKENITSSDIAYSETRLFSAELWSSFFSEESTETRFELQKDYLKELCLGNLDEARQRLAYLEIFYPFSFEGIGSELDHAYSDFKNHDYALCIFRTNKAKADSDMILNGIHLSEQSFNESLEKKLSIAKNVIGRQQEKGTFPILGYSYYEYAGSLKESEPASAMVYAEYSLQLSDLQMYLASRQNKARLSFDYSYAFIFLAGGFLGLLIGLWIWRNEPSKRKRLKMHGR